MSTDKNLADVQPGGRVRLGDAAPTHDQQTIERVAKAMQALEQAQSGWTWADCSPIEVEGWMDLARAAVAALSAQPSPVGQEDAVHCGKCKGRGYVHVDVDVDDSGGSIGNIEACPHCTIAAQPSPGGHGGALAMVRSNLRSIADIASKAEGDPVAIANINCEVTHALQLLDLAARQPEVK